MPADLGGLLTSQTTKKPSRAGITASSSPSGDYTTKTVQIVDYYPEEKDGIRNLYVAIIFQDFNGHFDSLKQPLTEIGREILQDKDVYGNWQCSQSYPDVFEDDEMSYGDFASYIKTIDNKTDGDDRLILLIVGHGADWYGTYHLKFESGEEIPESTLKSLLATLGPALDFLWLFSCHSELFGAHEAESLGLDAKEFILWCYHGDTLINTMAIQAENFKNALENGITKIEGIYSWMTSTENLTRFDYYPGYLDIPVLGPAYEEPSEGSTYGVILIPSDQIVITPM